jgi:hypothetical protein
MNDRPDALRLRLTFYIALAGIAGVLIAFGACLGAFFDSDNPGEIIPAVLGPVTAVIGTLAGYVAGQAAGSAGKERAEDRAAAAKDEAAQAQRQLGAVAGLGSARTGEDLMSQARQQFPEWFQQQAGEES